MMNRSGSVYTVAQINAYIRNMFSQDYLLGRVSVKGEVSNCKYHTSGHIYFTLKDARAAISCVMFAGNRKGLSFRLQDGAKVVVSGSVSVYEKGGSYQLYAQEIHPDGLGELYLKFEALKRELQEMGMFDPQYKKPLPPFVRTLGVVTASTGAAVRDIVQISRRRNPGIRILLFAAKVQGEGASASIAEGIRAMAAEKPDVIIVGRGGGSIEDLWAFNEEIVARAIFDCPVPVISAVGHETDMVISDFVADLRAPTPSAAAELAVADVRQILMRMGQYEERIRSRMDQYLAQARRETVRYARQLKLLEPARRVQQQKQTLTDARKMLQQTMKQHLEWNRQALEEKQKGLQLAMQHRLEREKGRLSIYGERLRGVSPGEKLSLGYAVVAKRENTRWQRISSVQMLQPEEQIRIWFSDGSVDARIKSKKDGS